MEAVTTNLTKFACCECGTYNEPYLTTTKGQAKMQCKECNSMYEVNTFSSKNFRLVCSKLSRKNPKSMTYFTKYERKVKKILLDLGYKEGFDWVHNARFYNGKGYYYTDFWIPKNKSIIEVDPSIWHDLRVRQKAKVRRIKFFTSNNILVCSITDKQLQLPNKELKTILDNYMRVERDC